MTKLICGLLAGLTIAGVLSACSGGDRGDACDPFPSSAAERIRGCNEGLVCVGTKSKGRCVSMHAGS